MQCQSVCPDILREPKTDTLFIEHASKVFYISPGFRCCAPAAVHFLLVNVVLIDEDPENCMSSHVFG